MLAGHRGTSREEIADGDRLLAVGARPTGADAAAEHLALRTALLAQESRGAMGAFVDRLGHR